MGCPRPAFNYYGSKWRLAPTIISSLPAHTIYVEPFGGSMAVLLRKPRSYLETYNDLDGEVVNFFIVLRERTDELIRAIELTPFARAELDLAYEPADDPLEQARRFYVRAIQRRGGPTAVHSCGWRFEKSGTRGKPLIANWNETYHLWAVVERIKQVQIDHDTSERVIARYDAPGSVFYCDPPYPAVTRKRYAETSYAHELDDAGHEALAAQLHEIEGMAIVSSYPNEMYDGLYADWRRVEVAARNQVGDEATEVLWISPRCDAGRFPLFNLEE